MDPSPELRPMICAALVQPWYQTRLPQPLEDAFNAAMAPMRLRTMRSYMVILCILSVGMLWADRLDGAGAWQIGAILRLAVGLPLGAVGAVLVGRLRHPAAQATAHAAIIIAFVTGRAAFAHYVTAHFADRYLMVGGLMVFSSNAVVPLRLRHAVPFTLVAMLSYLGATLLPFGPHDPGNLDVMVFMVLMMLVSLRVRWRIERSQMQAVLLHMLEEQHVAELSRANARLHALSNTDPLTGVANRRAFDEALQAAWREAAASRQPLGLVMLDVDHFKRFNDTAGHAEGDNCLRLIARALRDHVRQGVDVVARYGGEEFAALLPGTAPAEAAEIAERVRQAVEVMCLPHPGHPGRLAVVTVSIGVAAATPGGEMTDAARLITAADGALYAAKRAGRNRIAQATAVAAG